MARVGEWFHRYAVAEVAGLVCALVAAVAVGRTAGPAAAAIAGTLGEGVGFYGVILLLETARGEMDFRRVVFGQLQRLRCLQQLTACRAFGPGERLAERA